MLKKLFKRLLGKKKQKEVVYFFINRAAGKGEIEELEKDLSSKIGKKAVVLDARFSEVTTR